jgi:hypothetical protein
MDTPTTVIEEYAQLPARIRASSTRCDELGQQLKHERETRDELIVQAVDHAGIPAAEVARIAGMTQTHVTRILAAASSD